MGIKIATNDKGTSWKGEVSQVIKVRFVVDDVVVIVNK